MVDTKLAVLLFTMHDFYAYNGRQHACPTNQIQTGQKNLRADPAQGILSSAGRQKISGQKAYTA
jgi:hypothetical protein